MLFEIRLAVNEYFGRIYLQISNLEMNDPRSKTCGPKQRNKGDILIMR